MTTVLFIATIVCITANAFVAAADYAEAGFVLANSAEVHVPVNALPTLATLKASGALGLAVGLLAVPWLGVAAGIGLVLFFVGAIVVHLRARVLYNIAFPGAFLLLAMTSTAYLTHLAINP
ncbi:DoxX family protein [Rhodococcus sp. F64268]|uniref:DoxX family protein n=1 Tax=Rhodococcus sp. F64268 TaxID=2926402 RepID=UPI001FF58C45|nr:DoxX family protein [Rhodococcus sp. F64268]MCK0093377.1 DoxX family protein [Rhodococcus sp. F64268]